MCTIVWTRLWKLSHAEASKQVVVFGLWGDAFRGDKRSYLRGLHGRRRRSDCAFSLSSLCSNFNTQHLNGGADNIFGVVGVEWNVWGNEAWSLLPAWKLEILILRSSLRHVCPNRDLFALSSIIALPVDAKKKPKIVQVSMTSKLFLSTLLSSRPAQEA